MDSFLQLYLSRYLNIQEVIAAAIMAVNWEFGKHCKAHDYNKGYLDKETQQMEIVIPGRRQIGGMVVLHTPVGNLDEVILATDFIEFTM